MKPYMLRKLAYMAPEAFEDIVFHSLMPRPRARVTKPSDWTMSVDQGATWTDFAMPSLEGDISSSVYSTIYSLKKEPQMCYMREHGYWFQTRKNNLPFGKTPPGFDVEKWVSYEIEWMLMTDKNAMIEKARDYTLRPVDWSLGCRYWWQWCADRWVLVDIKDLLPTPEEESDSGDDEPVVIT